MYVCEINKCISEHKVLCVPQLLSETESVAVPGFKVGNWVKCWIYIIFNCKYYAFCICCFCNR